MALFATPQTAPNGQFLGGDPTWVQWDQQIITELGLDFTEEWAGSETGILAALNTAYQARAPILFYFYQPHWAFAEYDLTQLPPYSSRSASRRRQTPKPARCRRAATRRTTSSRWRGPS